MTDRKLNAHDRVPSKPFLQWLEGKRHSGETNGELGRRMDLKQEHIGDMQSGKLDTIPLDTVDWVLCHDGSTHLDELYPFEEEQDD